MQCLSIASLSVPFPFTIMAIMTTVFMFISHYMKNGGGDSNGTAFFISCLAIIDILLRVNWFVLGCLAIQKQFYGSAGWCAIILVISCILNLVIWRRFFKFKYNLDENDRAFVTYCKAYPKTSRSIIFLSYCLSF